MEMWWIREVYIFIIIIIWTYVFKGWNSGILYVDFVEDESVRCDMSSIQRMNQWVSVPFLFCYYSLIVLKLFDFIFKSVIISRAIVSRPNWLFRELVCSLLYIFDFEVPNY